MTEGGSEMNKINLTKIVICVILVLNVVGLSMNCQFMKDYSEFQSLVWRMDTTQNRLIKELVDCNNKIVDNHNAFVEYLKTDKEETK